MLALLLLVDAVLGRDTPKTTNFIVKSVKSCPDVGYFFQRELAINSLNPGPCYLCFCQNDGTAICWLRENRRCDLESYHHHGVGRRDTRVRRSLGDIFFRDAARDIFNKRLPEQCKPFESSFSDGCPPVDWCIGCTVCDCDAHGRWDCHVLSFCPESTTKKKSKKRRGPYKKTVIRKSSMTANTKEITKVTSKPKANPKSKPQPKIIKKIVKKATDKRFKRQQAKQTKQKPKPRKVIRRRFRSNRKVTKKNIATRKPVQLKNTQIKQIVLPSTPSLNQAVVRQVLAAVQKLLRHDLTKGNASRILNIVGRKPLENHKRVMVNNSKRNNVKTSKVTVRSHNNKQSETSKKLSKEQKIIYRNKRNVNIDEIRFNVSTASTVKEKYTDLNAFVDLTMENLPPKKASIDNVTTTPSTIITDSAYYNYVFDTHTNKNNTALKQLPANTYTEYVLVSRSKPKLDHNFEKFANFTQDILGVQENKKKTLANVISSIESQNKINNSKIYTWSQLKILTDKEKQIKNELVEFKNANRYENRFNETMNNRDLIFKNKLHSKDVKRKFGLAKKIKIKKIINPFKKGRDSKINIKEPSVIRATGSIFDLKNTLKNLLNEFNKNNTVRVKPKVKKLNVIKYLKRFLNKIFHKNTKKLLKNKQVLFNKRHVIETLCQTFGPCKVSHEHKMVLKDKLEDLNTETKKILKTITVIKGLLHLLESPKGNNKINNILKNNKSDFNDDIQKLNTIIKGTYKKLSPDKLTETQETQIDYIKKNTNEFIQSIGKFSNLLNEIVAILTAHRSIKPENKKYYRVLRSSKEDKNCTHDAFRNLKNLLFQYDFIQNTFIHRMYEALFTFESKLNTETQQKVAMEKKIHNMASINNISRNILTSLRKLTMLAKGLNSRRKREAFRDEDTVEYLLMLMEYLLKQNYPLDAAPANDGIDLLIEAIKNAPDIKTIKKKVLDYTPAPEIATITITGKANNINYDSLSDSNKISNEVTNTVETVTLKLDDPKFIEQGEEDRNDNDKYIYERKAIESNTENIVNIENTEKDKVVQFEPVTAYDIYERNKIIKVEEKEGMAKFKGDDDDVAGSRRYEVFNADMDEDAIKTSTFTVTIDTFTSPLESTTKTVSKFNIFNEDSSQSEVANKKTKLDWIEENYANEIKEFKDFKTKNVTKSLPLSTVKPIKATKKPIEDNDSSITKELKDQRKKENKVEVDEVMFKKQMDLLNSLDYGTEKTEIDTESKDVISDDRYTGDAFPSYFI